MPRIAVTGLTRLCCCAVALASCHSASRLDPGASGAAGSAGQPSDRAADPWSAPAAPAGKPGDSARSVDDSGLGDLRGMLARLADTVAKPGHYEAPESSSEFDPNKPHWGVLAIGGDIVERESWSLTGGHGTELRQLIGRLRELAADDKLTGVILRVDPVAISLPDAIELRAAFEDVRKAGKRIACHAEGGNTATYVVLTACDRIGLAPLGDLAVTGPAAMPIHIKSLLDKLGIEADFLHVGAYKGAAEPLTRDAPSKEMDETIAAILDRRYQTIVELIAAGRKRTPEQVRAWIDTALFPSDQAQAAGLVDEVGSFEAFRDAAIAPAAWTKLELEPERTDKLAMVLRLSRFLGALPPERPATAHVAVVYALGNIVDGEGEGVLGARQQIAAATLVAALRAIAGDDTVKAVVLRIDSGGGSAQASELIWRAVAELKARKPVIASMSDVAASGGYYIASGASKIFALDDTLTGSIGVVGGKLAPRNALARLGIQTFPVGRGKRATMTANLGRWSNDERQAIQSAMQAVYRVFVGRVADGRGKTVEQIQAIAEGRVWTGARALQLGLVDAIGGLDAAIAEARGAAKLGPTSPLEIYPPAPTLRDVLSGFGQVRAPFGLDAGLARAASSELAALTAAAPAVEAAVAQLIGLVGSFRGSTVQAVAILPVLQ